MDKKLKDIVYYKCAARSVCSARFIVKNGTGIYTSRVHNHPNNRIEILKAALKQRLRTEASRSFEAYKTIFDRICRDPQYQEAAIFTTYASVVATMRTARSSSYPQAPTSPENFLYLLESEKGKVFCTIGDDKFYYGHINYLNSLAIFFVVPATLTALSTVESTTLQLDGTFKTCPKIFAQIFMAYATISEHVFPLAFILVDSEHPTEQYYKKILRKLKTFLPIKIERVVTDFEKSLINASVAVFPEASHQGCLFHFKQAIKNYIIQKLRVSKGTKEYIEFRMAMQIAHLPADRIAEGINLLHEDLKSSVENKEAVRKFMEYFRKQWILNIHPRIYSAYRTTVTSNNAAESFHSKMLREVGCNPPPWEFLACICGDNPTFTLEPCLHKTYCNNCIWKELNRNKKCPKCGVLWKGMFKDPE
ncbi:uncharacterized protein LOC131677473 isoform X2 [Topomyia yanbarensis]|uniref:uncharacterized protein LOC131677473 isoform X2 n=1 Tax=Topomyia yanbarensis TaxID=2498891 RepID=UPI00273CDDB8|nr:uncharacterized protein LOC131677473 isoform X2 [Topomyia yanbarensis]